MKTLLALDVATVTGWAYGEISPDTKPVCGALRFGRAPSAARGDSGSTDDEIWAAALKWVHEQIKVMQPTVVALEAPIMSSQAAGGTNAHTMGRLLGLQAVLRAVISIDLPHPARLVHVQSARKVFIGKGNLPGEQAKRLVRKRCIELGWLTDEEATYDKADALCVWAKAASDIDPSIKTQFTPLFVAARKERA